MAVVRNVLATPSHPLPILTRVVEVPVFTPTGALVTQSGYDPASGLYYSPVDRSLSLSIPVEPSEDEVADACTWIDDLHHEFPFVSPADRTHAVALMVLPFARDLIDGPTPNHLIEAPAPGSGKGLLAETTLSPAVGQRVGMVAEAKDDDEWRKRITARLREGCPVTCFDNLSRPLVSGVVSTALTAMQWEDRLLGKTETLTLPVRTVWVTTANNPVLSLEIARRTIRIRLDPKVDRPFLRHAFEHQDLRGWALAHRPDLIGAVLVLIRAWLAAGRPGPTARPLGSYEQWTTVIGGIVEHAGYKDFLGNQLEFYETVDSEGASWRLFVDRWWEKYREQEVGVSELFPIADEVEGLNLGKGSSDQSRRTALGKQLQKQRERVVGIYRTEHVGEYQHRTLWRLRCVEREMDQSTLREEEVIHVGSLDH